MTTADTRVCGRCHRVDDYSDLAGWIEEDDGWTCPNCFTPGDRLMVDIHEEKQSADFWPDDE